MTSSGKIWGNPVIAASVGLCLLLVAGSGAMADKTPQYDRDIRPILSKNCFACHGPDAQSREGGFRLDRQVSATGGALSGKRPIVPTDPAKSELIRRIYSKNDSEQMPPADSHKTLSDADRQALRQWIAAGANYERHWSYEPPRGAMQTPSVRQQDWPRNPIDSFILARLESERLSPSPIASRETLVRRVTLDLTGLPPSPEEVVAFVEDHREDAYERLVDRLISTTDYAERRAQDWLDLARYADTRGFADDKMRHIWPYRDWVVRAISRNLPFDQFTIQQLAGDMLPGATDEQRIATGFHRNAPQAKGNTYPVEEYRIKGVIDRVNTTGRVWMGLTLGCAECHDHKFDPITQHDYYSLLSIFNNIEHGGSGFDQGGPTMNYPLVSSQQHERIVAERDRARAKLLAARKRIPPQAPLDDKSMVGSWTGSAVASNVEKFDITGDLTITARIRTRLPVADIVSKYDWQDKQRSYVFGIGGEGDKESVPGTLFFWASSEAAAFRGVTVAGSQKVNDLQDHHVAVVFEAGKAVRLFVDGMEDLSVKASGNVPASIAKSNRRLSIGAGYAGAKEPTAHRFEGDLRDVRIFNAALADRIRIEDETITRLQQKIRDLEIRISEASKSSLAVPVMRERSKRRETFVHVRGDFLNRGVRVTPSVPALFEVAANLQPRNRLELAKWLVNGENPLVARVVVNRYWQNYFGRGLAPTPDDFGAQGTPPTHPDLLDWLAHEFVVSGWDMKHIHRLIVTSATYRQATRVTEELQSRDPKNLLLGRMPRLRLPAEQIRDQALAVSGLLTKRVGGPPVFPHHPKDYWQQRALPGEWINSRGEDQYRRTLYTYWRRMALHPSLELLNAPPRESCVAQRDVSNVPTQALVLLNDPMFQQAAGALAERLVKHWDADDAQKLERAFRIVLGRSPRNDERAKFLGFLMRQRKDLQAELAGTGTPTDLRESIDSVNVAVWKLACSVLLNLDETITRP